jgi:hypothetical protein
LLPDDDPSRRGGTGTNSKGVGREFGALPLSLEQNAANADFVKGETRTDRIGSFRASLDISFTSLGWKLEIDSRDDGKIRLSFEQSREGRRREQVGLRQ